MALCAATERPRVSTPVTTDMSFTVKSKPRRQQRTSQEETQAPEPVASPSQESFAAAAELFRDPSLTQETCNKSVA